MKGIWLRVRYISPSGTVFTRDIRDPDSLSDKYKWVAGLASASPDRETSNSLNKQFSSFDGNGDKRISLEEWVDAKKRLNGSRFNKSHVESMFKKYDKNADHYLDESEFR